MTAICTEPGCGYPAKDEKGLAAHRKFQHEGGDPVVSDQPTLKAPRARKPKVESDPGTTSLGSLLVLTPAKRGGKTKAQAKAKTSADAIEAFVAGTVEPTAAVVKVDPRRKPAKPRAATKVEAAALDIPIYPTREAWMLAAVDIMRPWYTEAGLAPVPEVRISVGWAGGRGSKKGVRGQCWASHTTSDKKPAIFVTPDQDDPLTILGIILHEMNHASDDGVSGHKGTFAKNAATLGFEKPWTSSEGKNEDLTERLKGVLKELGVFPHGRITDKTHGLTGLLGGPGGAPVQSTRMLKVQCESCGCIIRMTQKWINEAGTPTCGCGGLMFQDAASIIAGLGL